MVSELQCTIKTLNCMCIPCKNSLRPSLTLSLILSRSLSRPTHLTLLHAVRCSVPTDRPRPDAHKLIELDNQHQSHDSTAHIPTAERCAATTVDWRPYKRPSTAPTASTSAGVTGIGSDAPPASTDKRSPPGAGTWGPSPWRS